MPNAISTSRVKAMIFDTNKPTIDSVRQIVVFYLFCTRYSIFYLHTEGLFIFAVVMSCALFLTAQKYCYQVCSTTYHWMDFQNKSPYMGKASELFLY